MQTGVGAGAACITGGGVDIVIGIDGVIVVAPEHQNDRLVHLREVRCQLAQHGVCIPDAGSEILQRTHGAALKPYRVGYDVYPLVVRVVVSIIIGMVLHGDRVQEDGLIRGSAHLFVLLNDLVGHGIIRHKAAGPVVLAHLGHAVHIFQTDKIAEAEVGVGLIAAPVFCPEAVHRSGLVALELEVIGQGEHGLCDVLLVGLTAAGQEGHRVAGQRFKLHITGATAKAGAVGPAVGAGLLQSVKVLRYIGIKGDAVLFQLGNIPVGLIHHINNGRLLRLLLLGGGGGIAACVHGTGGEFLALCHVIQNTVNCLLRVAIGLVDFQIGEVGHKTGKYTVVTIVAVLHPRIRRDAQNLRDCGLQVNAEDQQTQRRRRSTGARKPWQPALAQPPAINKEACHHKRQHQHNGDHHAGLELEPGSRGHTGSLGHLHQIPRQKGLAPQLHGVKVYRAGCAAQNGHAQRSKRRDAQHPVQQLPHQKQQQPCQQVRPEMGKNKADKGISGQ